jgi:hypothetical protein
MINGHNSNQLTNVVAIGEDLCWSSAQMSDLISDVLMGTDWAKPTTRSIVIFTDTFHTQMSFPIHFSP